MKIGLVGYKGSGKSTLFEWLTGAAADPAMGHTTQAAMASVPDDRMEAVCEIYRPKKSTLAALEIVDTPGLSRTHEGSAAKLVMIREAGCLVLVVGAYNGAPAADLANFQDDLLIADLAIVAGRIERLRESLKKPRPDRDELRHELELLGPLYESLETGKPVRELELSLEQQRAIRSFQLFTEKPRLVVVNVADDEEDTQQFDSLAPAGAQCIALPLALQLELQRMDAAERAEFCREMNVASCDRGSLIRSVMEASRQMLFFTVSDKEVRTWMIPRGSTAVEAAGAIHTDLARGFIRAEVMSCDDLVRLGGEREVKAQNLMRQEPKSYVVQDGDVLYVRHG